jgi:methyltransferase (TIGR00027 family)
VDEGQPSRTALAAAAHRAAHQILEGGSIFTDPLALRILGDDTEIATHAGQEDASRRRMRIFIAARARYAEDALAEAVSRGRHQLVMLGAGLDTFAYRNPFGELLRVFEVDHPDTQVWKRERLIAATIRVPDSLTFVPVDFERQTLPEVLTAAGLNPTKPTFFTWMGVVPYLSEPVVWSTFTFIGSLPGGADVVFDYSDPPELLPPEKRKRHDERARRVEAMGEAFACHFEPEILHAKLRELGFRDIEDLGPPFIAERYFPSRMISSSRRGGHIVRASTGFRNSV